MKKSGGIKYCLGVSVALCVLYLVGVADLDYGYYTFLRIFSLVALGSLIFVYAMEVDKLLNPVTIVAGVLLILFNPILPIYLDKEVWVVLDIISAVAVLGTGGYIFFQTRSKGKKENGEG